MKSHSLFLQHIVPLGLILTFCIFSLSGCQKQDTTSKTADYNFEKFTDSIFLEEITANTLNLHYSLENPKAFGITDYKISLDDFSKNTRESSDAYLRQTKLELLSHSYHNLSLENQLTFDILFDYLNTQIALCNYDLYQEPLSYSGGIQMELPILFAEYEFHTKQDVKDYLELIALTDEYYAQIMKFEQEKSTAGLFMSAELCQAVIESCYAFLEDKEEHYLMTTFENRIKELNLSKKETTAYIKKNEKILTEQLFPAYENMITELKTLQNSGKNKNGLCYLPEGKEYYKLLVYSETGCDDSIDEIFRRIELQRLNDLVVCAALQKEDETIFEKCNTLNFQMNDPNMILQHLQEKILEDFPIPPESAYEINYVDAALEDYLAPAFYIVAPLDNYKENTIYINKGQVTDNLYAFTTLAHEGYPGHLYQTVMSYEYELPEIRAILNCGGYTEGWATYIEMMSYEYAGIDENIATMLSHNQAATLSLYASSDIGIHYYGWTKEDMLEFWSGYGITNTDIINEITQLIHSEPGNYLKYYVGYIEFLELLDYVQSELGDDFSLKEFHRTVLDIGPAPFTILEKYFLEYYNSPQT